MRFRIPKRRRAAAVLAMSALFGMAVPSQAQGDESGLPGSCKLHPTHVVNPGCIPALTTQVFGPTPAFPNVVPDIRNVAIYSPVVPGPEPGTFVIGDPALSFDGWVQNLGAAPLELMADDPMNPTTVEQCMAWTATYVCREHREVGGYAWHEEHSHYHFQDFADYQLRYLGTDGRPDYSDAGLIAHSEKVSFCLVDSTLVDPSKGSPPLYISCGPTRQGVSPGWADIYDVGTPGQQLPIDGLADGRYALVVTMDYANRIFESNDSDNRLEVTVELSENATRAVIVDKRLA